MKHSYHSDIAIQYKLGILDNTFTKQIPSSTLHNWKRKDFSLLVGAEYVSDFERNIQMIKDFLSRKYLLNAAKAIYFVYSAYVTILNSVKNRDKILRQSNNIIIPTIDKIKDGIGLKRALRAFSISYQQYYAWKKKVQCKVSPFNICRKLHPNQLTTKEVDTLKEYLKNPKYFQWNLTPVYFQMLRDKAAFMSKTSFYKYANLLMLTRAKPEKKKYGEGIRADAPKRILHMDVTIYRPLDHTKVYIYLLMVNFSRFILNWKASLKYSANITFENINEAYLKFNLDKINPYIDLVCDGGSENKGIVENFVNGKAGNIQKLVAQTDIIFSNSMVEAVNKRMKYDFLFTTKLFNIEQTVKYLTYAVEQYNNKPHSALYGLTPIEAFNGNLPDKNMFKPAIRQAAAKRKMINRGQQCLNCFESNPD
jgi:hypothetical protein